MGVEDGLHKDQHGTMLALNTQFFSLEVDVNGVHIVNTAMFLSLLLNPVAEFVVDGVATTFAVLILIVAKPGFS